MTDPAAFGLSVTANYLPYFPEDAAHPATHFIISADAATHSYPTLPNRHNGSQHSFRSSGGRLPRAVVGDAASSSTSGTKTPHLLQALRENSQMTQGRGMDEEHVAGSSPQMPHPRATRSPPTQRRPHSMVVPPSAEMVQLAGEDTLATSVTSLGPKVARPFDARTDLPSQPSFTSTSSTSQMAPTIPVSTSSESTMVTSSSASGLASVFLSSSSIGGATTKRRNSNHFVTTVESVAEASHASGESMSHADLHVLMEDESLSPEDRIDLANLANPTAVASSHAPTLASSITSIHSASHAPTIVTPTTAVEEGPPTIALMLKQQRPLRALLSTSSIGTSTPSANPMPSTIPPPAPPMPLHGLSGSPNPVPRSHSPRPFPSPTSSRPTTPRPPRSLTPRKDSESSILRSSSSSTDDLGPTPLISRGREHSIHYFHPDSAMPAAVAGSIGCVATPGAPNAVSHMSLLSHVEPPVDRFGDAPKQNLNDPSCIPDLPDTLHWRCARELIQDSEKGKAIMEKVKAHPDDPIQTPDIFVHYGNGRFCREFTTLFLFKGGEDIVQGKRLRFDLSESDDVVQSMCDDLQKAETGLLHSFAEYRFTHVSSNIDSELHLHIKWIQDNVFIMTIDWSLEESLARHEDFMDKWRNMLYYAEIHVPTNTIRLSSSAAALMQVDKLIWPRSEWRTMIHPDDRAHVFFILGPQRQLQLIATFQVAMCFIGAVNGTTGDRVEFKYRFKSPKANTYKKVLSRFSVMSRDKDKKTLSMVGNFIDLTALEQAEIALEASENLVKGFVSTIEAVVIAADADGYITYCSEYVESLMGLNIAFLVGKHPKEWRIRPDMEGTDVHFINLWTDHIERQKPLHTIFEWYFVDSNSKQKQYLQVKANPRYDDDGLVSGWNGFIADVTTSKLMEAKLAENNKQLQSALQIKENFLHNVSHEVRTPLNGISGLLTILSDSTLTPQQREWCGIALDCCDSLLHITVPFLSFEKCHFGDTQRWSLFLE